MPSFGTKKICNLLGKKIMQPLGTKKNHPSSWDKNITQPLGTDKITQPLKKKSRNLLKKKSRNLSGKKSRNLSGQKKNHAAY